jgi:hypothetical protein
MKKILSFIFALMMCLTAQATGLVDLKFGRAQIADSQWNVNACTQTTTCQIYSKNPGTAYRIPWTSGQLSWATGDYVAFQTTGNATNPWNAVQYNASGAQKSVMGTGHIINMGSDYFFFVGNDNNTGQLFSMTQGFNNTSGVTWTGTLNPTVAQVNAYAANGSTTPLAAGQTAAPPPPPPPVDNSTAAGTMPGGYIGRILNNTPGQFQNYSFTYTPGQTGSQYVQLAFRQDPAYWTVTNVSLTAGGSSTNLLQNGNFASGGTITAQTNNGPMTVNTPTYWGVAYQSGIYPGAAGNWSPGQWYDGAVGSFDAIYQGVSLTAGVTYTVTITVRGDNTGDTSLSGGVQLGVYAGKCNNLTLSPDQCSLPSNSGYTTLATPSEGASAGNTAPTITGTSTSNSTSSSSTTSNNFQGTTVNDIIYNGGTISGYDSIVYGTDYQVTTTTVTTPVTTTYWSDGTSTTSNGTSTTSQSVTDTYNVWKVYEIPSWSYTIPVVSGNSVYLNQSGSNPSVTIEQVGQRNTVAGINNPNAYLIGNNNSLVIRQAGDDNLALVNVSGNNNSVQIPQGYYHNWANGFEYPAAGSANNIALVDVIGNGNWVFMPQQGYRNLATSSTNGNSNNNTIVQYGNDNKAYNFINGDGNNLSSWQQGNGNLSTISITGNGNRANTTQTGNNNLSTITLINAGGPNNVTVNQYGSTPQSFVLQQSCTTPSGCSVSVSQH